jgi:hypothetical protein
MAKQLTWTDDGLSTTDGRYVIGVVHGTDGQPVHYYWEACPKLKVKRWPASARRGQRRHGDRP